MHYCDLPQHASLLIELRAERARADREAALADRLIWALPHTLVVEDPDVRAAVAAWRAART